MRWALASVKRDEPATLDGYAFEDEGWIDRGALSPKALNQLGLLELALS